LFSFYIFSKAFLNFVSYEILCGILIWKIYNYNFFWNIWY